MVIFHLAGHSGAGKTRLINALSKRGMNIPRAVLYTSRMPRKGEVHGIDYYFLSRGAIAALPEEKFFVGPMRDMLQAVDLVQLEEDLRSGRDGIVLVEIFSGLWPGLLKRIAQRIKGNLRIASVFMTAIDPDAVKALPDEQKQRSYIRKEVERNLSWRAAEGPEKIAIRAKSAENEILAALGLIESKNSYDAVLHSAPEGPDGEDDWTREIEPTGRAKDVLEEIIQRITTAADAR